MDCPSCASSEHAQVLTGATGDVSLGRCTGCGLVRLTSGELTDQYSYYDSRVGLTRDQLYLSLTSERLAETLAALATAPGRRLLDVGCGEGQLVAVAAQQGWDARGIDLAAGAISICRSFGLPCERLDVFSDELGGGQFDVVTMVELIEHVPDPGRFLARCRGPADAGWARVHHHAELVLARSPGARGVMAGDLHRAPDVLHAAVVPGSRSANDRSRASITGDPEPLGGGGASTAPPPGSRDTGGGRTRSSCVDELCGRAGAQAQDRRIASPPTREGRTEHGAPRDGVGRDDGDRPGASPREELMDGFSGLEYTAVFLVCLVLTNFLTPLALRVALRRRILDHPSEIKAQESPVPTWAVPPSCWRSRSPSSPGRSSGRRSRDSTSWRSSSDSPSCSVGSACWTTYAA